MIDWHTVPEADVAARAHLARSRFTLIWANPVAPCAQPLALGAKTITTAVNVIESKQHKSRHSGRRKVDEKCEVSI